MADPAFATGSCEIAFREDMLRETCRVAVGDEPFDDMSASSVVRGKIIDELVCVCLASDLAHVHVCAAVILGQYGVWRAVHAVSFADRVSVSSSKTRQVPCNVYSRMIVTRARALHACCIAPPRRNSRRFHIRF